MATKTTKEETKREEVEQTPDPSDAKSAKDGDPNESTAAESDEDE